MNEEEIIKVITYKLNMKNADVYAPILYDEIQSLLELYNKEKESNKEYERILDIWDNRKYRKRYLEERRKEQPNLLYPDADEIYQKYYEEKEKTTKQEKMIQKIHENFCKFDWKNSNGEQVHNQLKELYESIFKNEGSDNK